MIYISTVLKHNPKKDFHYQIYQLNGMEVQLNFYGIPPIIFLSSRDWLIKFYFFLVFKSNLSYLSGDRNTHAHTVHQSFVARLILRNGYV